MKRELKFRFWIEKECKMADFKTAKRECDRLSLLSMDGFIAMQFTGLLDKNGIEIYEGDIVENTDNNVQEGEKPYKTKLKVEYVGGGFSFTGDRLCMYGLRDNQQMSIEVVGNIYENPELLKS